MPNRWTTALPWLAAVLVAAPVQAGALQGAQALQARHAALSDALAHSPFGRPLLLQASAAPDQPSGDVDAVLDQPFAAVAPALQPPGHWCDILLLQTNVKRCRPEGSGAGQRLEVAVARRYTDRPEQAEAVRFRYTVQAAQPGYLSVSLAADDGPVGTHHYRLAFEAVPLGDRQTFVHLSYRYEPGLLARVATRAYLAGAGRDKVGFGITGHDAEGRPIHVRGIQGVAERNTMRYFLAIEAFLATLGAPPAERLERRLEHFHAALERYPAQLHETTLAEYLAMKRREAG